MKASAHLVVIACTLVFAVLPAGIAAEVAEDIPAGDIEGLVAGITPLDQPILALEFVGDASGEALEVTGEHPIWARDRGWVAARDLLPGDEVFTSAGGWLRISSGTWLARSQTVYNLDVEEADSYFVGERGVWVHNNPICPPASRGIPQSLNVGSRQFGRKVAQPARELGLDPSSAQVRARLGDRIQRIFRNADEVRAGSFRGRGPNGGVGDVLFFRRGRDVVVTSPGGDFVTLLTNGANNNFFRAGSVL